MNAPNEPRQLVTDPRKRKILKWAGIAVAAPAVILFILVSVFVARTQYMHDEERCPFEHASEQLVSEGVVVVEQARSCQEGVEEHRWLVRRGGRPDREIGRRRLMTEGFADYHWSATLEGAWVHVHVRNEGVEDARFREGPE